MALSRMSWARLASGKARPLAAKGNLGGNPRKARARGAAPEGESHHPLIQKGRGPQGFSLFVYTNTDSTRRIMAFSRMSWARLAGGKA